MEMIKAFFEYSNYSVTYDGRVYSAKSDLYLVPQFNSRLYKRVKIYDGKGNSRWYLVHRLVALVWIPNPNNKPQVHHIDGDIYNNTVSNLRWVTNVENQKFKSEKFWLDRKNDQKDADCPF